MNIYEILSSKSHNNHYLKRYYNFINSCIETNKNLLPTDYTENHHICPKAKDLFPEYRELLKFPWNKAILTGRQHFVAHWILSKAYPESNVCIGYIRMMTSKKSGIRFTSRQYENAKKQHQKIATIIFKKYREEFGHPRGMLGKTFTKSQEMIDKTSGKNNGMFGTKRPDLALSNIDPKINAKRKISLRETLLLKSCKSIGFNTIKEAKDYFTSAISKIETNNSYTFMGELNSLFKIDFPNIIPPRGRIIFLIDSFNLSRPKRKSRLFNFCR